MYLIPASPTQRAIYLYSLPHQHVVQLALFFPKMVKIKSMKITTDPSNTPEPVTREDLENFLTQARRNKREDLVSDANPPMPVVKEKEAVKQTLGEKIKKLCAGYLYGFNYKRWQPGE
jgi:hypothetical protein